VVGRWAGYLCERAACHSVSTAVDNPHTLLIRVSLGLAVVVGFALGLYLVLGLHSASPALMQVHGQVQALGFVGLFIMGVAVQLLPRFHASRLDRPRQVAIGGLVLAGGLVLRTIAQPLALTETLRAPALVLSGVMELAGVAIAVLAFARLVRASVQPVARGCACCCRSPCLAACLVRCY
jgi:hypothetical protein